jgi:hypothetical protein
LFSNGRFYKQGVPKGTGGGMFEPPGNSINVVIHQIAELVAFSNQIWFSIRPYQNYRRQESGVVLGRLGERIRTAVQKRQHFAEFYIGRE